MGPSISHLVIMTTTSREQKESSGLFRGRSFFRTAQVSILLNEVVSRLPLQNITRPFTVTLASSCLGQYYENP